MALKQGTLERYGHSWMGLVFEIPVSVSLNVQFMQILGSLIKQQNSKAQEENMYT